MNWGSECKLGWGYHRTLNKLIPVGEEPPNIKSEVRNEWKCNLHINSNFVSLLLINEINCKYFRDV